MHGRQALELPAFQRRLDRQAAATQHLRSPLYERAALHRAATIVDVGCGSGAVTAELAQWGARVTAIDTDVSMARRTAAANLAGTTVMQADGANIPLPSDSVDAAVCNLMLLWAPNPQAVVAEMTRIVRPGGIVMATMEPDYGGKVHWPPNPLVDAIFEGGGVARRGGDPLAGRKLREQFVQAGLETDVGISNFQVPTPAQDLDNFRRHRTYYRRLLSESGVPPADMDAWESDYLDAIDAGTELCFLPIFHAIGRRRAD